MGSALMTQAPGPGPFLAPRLLTQDPFPAHTQGVPKVQETLKNTDILQVGGQRDLNRNEVPTLHLQL